MPKEKVCRYDQPHKYDFVVIEGERQLVHGSSHSKLPFWVISSQGSKLYPRNIHYACGKIIHMP